MRISYWNSDVCSSDLPSSTEWSVIHRSNRSSSIRSRSGNACLLGKHPNKQAYWLSRPPESCQSTRFGADFYASPDWHGSCSFGSAAPAGAVNNQQIRHGEVMKKIEAIIKPFKLDEVKDALHEEIGRAHV